MKYLDPTGETQGGESGAVKCMPRVRSLTGITLGVINNGWESMRHIGERIGQLAAEGKVIGSVRYYAVPRNKAPDDDVLRRVQDECDAAIVGLAN